MKMRENFDFLKTFDHKKIFTDTKWVKENDPEVYAALHDMMLKFVEDESNQTFEDDLEAFEASEWCVEYCFNAKNNRNLTVRIYAGETWQDVANQPPWLEETVTVEEFKENYPYKKYTKKLED